MKNRDHNEKIETYCPFDNIRVNLRDGLRIIFN